MAQLYADRAYLTIAGRTVECSSIDFSSNVDQEVIMPMNRINRATGYAGGPPRFELTIVVPMKRDGDDFDFHQALLDEVTFTAFVEVRGGQVYTFFDCKIKSVSTPASNGTVISQTIAADALDVSRD